MKNYHSLAPDQTKLTEDQQHYIKVLRKVIADPKNKNIAISAPYGAGKSTIIKALQDTYKSTWACIKEIYQDRKGCSFKEQYNCLKKSFQHHKKRKFLNITLGSYNDKNITSGSHNDTYITEPAIEKGILQQIIYSIDQKLLPFSRIERIKHSSLLNLFLTSLAFLGAFFSSITIFFPSVWYDNLFIPKGSDVITVWEIIFGISFIVLIFKIAPLISKINSAKFSINDVNLEIGHNNKLDILDMFTDEIIYCFTQAKYDIVVFEDLDRFKQYDIFRKLRNLNYLLNVHTKRDIVFIYAVRDDIFESENRTKFFEFILPIVPIINSSNSKAILKTKVPEVNETLVNHLSLWIDDMRVLLNIANEFNIYKTQIKDIDSLSDQLFSLMVYKNLFPQEFAQLEKNQGRVYYLFNDGKKKLIDIIKQYCKDSLNENHITYYKNAHTYSMKRLVNILDEEEIKNTEEFFENNKHDKLLRYLISEGHLTEKYHLVISIFHEDSLISEDRKYLMDILGRSNNDYKYIIHKPEILLNELIVEFFETRHVYNFSLFNHLLKSQTNRELYFKSFVKQLKNGDTHAYRFLYDYLKECDNIKILFEIFSHPNIASEVWTNFSQSTDYDIEIHTIFENFVKYASKDNFLKLCEVESFLIFLSKYENFLNIETSHPILNNKHEVINNIDFTFSKLNTAINPEDSRLIPFIVEFKRYEINMDMLTLILQHTYGDSFNLDGFTSSNFTTILQSDNQPLIQHIRENIETYEENVLRKIMTTNINESEESILELLNSTVSEQFKSDFLKTQQKMITDISRIKNMELWKYALKYEAIHPTMLNIATYYDNFGMDATLIAYINDNAEKKIIDFDDAYLSATIAHKEFDKDILITQISTIFLKQYLEAYPEAPYFYEINDKVHSDKISLLINLGMIKLSVNDFDLIDVWLPTLLMDYVMKNFSDYLNNIINCESKNIDVEKIINSQEIELDEKVTFVKHIDIASIKSEKEAISIKTFMIQNKTTRDDIEFIKRIIEFLPQSDNESKINFILSQESEIDTDSLKEILELLPEYMKFKGASKRHHINAKKTDYNQNFGALLKKRGIVSSCTPKEDSYKLIVN